MFSPDFRASRSTHDRRWFQSLVLHAVQATIIFLSFVVGTPATFSVWTYYEDRPVFNYFLLVFFWAVTLIRSIINFIHIRRKPTPIHPGWSVAIDLISSFGYGLATILTVGDFALETELISRCDYSTDPSHDPRVDTDSLFPKGCTYTSPGLHGAGLFFMGFGGLALFFISFYLFIRACMDTHRVRKGRSLGTYSKSKSIPLSQDPGANYFNATGKH